MSGKKASIWMESTMQSDRLESHGQEGNKEPIRFLNDLDTQEQGHRATAFRSNVLAVCHFNPLVSHRFQGQKIRADAGHAEGGARIHTQVVVEVAGRAAIHKAAGKWLGGAI